MTTEEKIIKNKRGLLRLAEELGNVSQACKMMGYSRDSFYRFRELYAEHGEAGLREMSRQKPNLLNRVAPEVEAAVVAYATEYPAYGQKRTSNELKKRGIFVSPSGVRSIWQRHNLENFKKRLAALEAVLAANQNVILTEAQMQALEKAKEQRKLKGKSKPRILAIWAHRIPTMSAPSKALDASTNRPSSTPTAKSLLRSCTPPSPPSWPPICSMTA